MNHLIYKSDKNVSALNKLIANGFYSGYVGPKKFELEPNNIPNNCRLIGILNDNGSYELRFDFLAPVSIAAKIAIIIGLVVSIFQLIEGNWMFPIWFVFFPLVLILFGYKLKQKREIKRFTDRMIAVRKKE